jgi:hypothetical protein
MAEVIYRGIRDRHDLTEQKEETRSQKARADILEMQAEALRKTLEGEVLSTKDVIAELEKGFAVIKAGIVASSLDRREQDSLLNHFAGIKKNVLSRVPHMKFSGGLRV